MKFFEQVQSNDVPSQITWDNIFLQHTEARMVLAHAIRSGLGVDILLHRRISKGP